MTVNFWQVPGYYFILDFVETATAPIPSNIKIIEKYLLNLISFNSNTCISNNSYFFTGTANRTEKKKKKNK